MKEIYTNYYRCPRCKTEWDEEGDEGQVADCPECRQKDVQPYYSEEDDGEF